MTARSAQEREALARHLEAVGFPTAGALVRVDAERRGVRRGPLDLLQDAALHIEERLGTDDEANAGAGETVREIRSLLDQTGCP